MTREEVITLLRSGTDGVAEWNRLRSPGMVEHLGKIPSLAGADLHGANLFQANLLNMDLSGADLRKAILTGANLEFTRLMHTNLEGAGLAYAKLNGANLAFACLRGVELDNAVLIGTYLADAELEDASLAFTSFLATRFDGTRLAGARFGTTIIWSDLSQAIGLDETLHMGPSTININSIRQFKDRLPEKFLRGCGLRDEEIDYFRSQLGRADRFCSCFISYSTEDQAFATRLYSDLRATGITCWEWKHDARTGKSLWGEIDLAIREHDKLVLIASESSLRSPAVNREIERALIREDDLFKQKQEGKFDGDVNVLFPVMLDDFILKDWEHERKVDVTKKFIADARGWNSAPSVYDTVRDRVIHDLKLESIK